MYEFCLHDMCLMQDTYWIARGGTILHLSIYEITFVSCNPNGRSPQDIADDSIQLDLILHLVDNFIAYEVMATMCISNIRVWTFC